MLDGTYKLSLNTPMGALSGNITLNTNGNNVQGILETLGMKSNFNGSKIAYDKCKFSGNLNTPMGKINYTATCIVVDNNLELDISTSQGSFNLKGKRI